MNRLRLMHTCFLVLALCPAAFAQQGAEKYISACKANYQTVITSLKFSIQDAKDPSAGKLSQLRPEEFCNCYGTKNFEAFNKGQVSPDVATVSTKNGAECAQRLLGLSQTPEVSAKSLQATGSGAFQSFFKSQFQTGRGIGGISLNDPSAKVLQVLGNPDRVSKGMDQEEWTYGPNLMDCRIQIIKGQIKAIKLGRTYQGQTDRGIRIGDSYESVKQKHGDAKPLIDELKRTLLYEDGTLFQFKNSKSAELQSISVVTPESFPLMAVALKQKTK